MATTSKTGVGYTVRNMVAGAEQELSRLIAYMNDEVVPEVRRTSAVGLRAAAEQMGRMAEQLDRNSAQSSAHGSRGREGERASAQASPSR